MTAHARPAPIDLDRIDVASPCSASWDAMEGDDRVRFCGDCKLNVYDFSAMTRPEAENLLRDASGRICGRFRRRTDGTVVTQDCGPVRRAIRQRLRRVRVAASALFGVLASFASLGCGGNPERAAPPETAPPVKLTPKPASVPETMGEICVPEAMLGRIHIPTPPPRPDQGLVRVEDEPEK